MVHSSLIACIKMGVSLTNPKQQAAIPLFGRTNILHMLVSIGSTALAAGVILPRYDVLNYSREINEVLSRCIILYNAHVKILNKSSAFTTKCIIVSKRVTENV